MLSLVIALLFLGAFYFFLSSFSRLRFNQKKFNLLTTQMEQLNRNDRELLRQKTVLDKINVSMDSIEESGIDRKRWVFHLVNVDGPATLGDAAMIINQTSNSNAYYFKPLSLHAKMQGGGNPATGSAAQILLNLRGSFVVQQR